MIASNLQEQFYYEPPSAGAKKPTNIGSISLLYMGYIYIPAFQKRCLTK